MLQKGTILTGLLGLSVIAAEAEKRMDEQSSSGFRLPPWLLVQEEETA